MLRRCCLARPSSVLRPRLLRVTLARPATITSTSPLFSRGFAKKGKGGKEDKVRDDGDGDDDDDADDNANDDGCV